MTPDLFVCGDEQRDRGLEVPTLILLTLQLRESPAQSPPSYRASRGVELIAVALNRHFLERADRPNRVGVG